MSGLQGLVEKIINELTRIHGLSFSDVGKDDHFPLPRLIATGNGGTLVVSKTIDQLIIEISHTLKQDKAALATTFSDQEWISWVRKAFGPALSTIDLDEPAATNANAVMLAVQTMLDGRLATLGPREYTFGCTLFGNEDTSAFTIGPVTFEPRLAWLDRKEAEQGVSSITHRRVEKLWQGTQSAKRKKPRKSVGASRGDDDILTAIGGCPYVCSVKTNGLAEDAGLEKALIAARLALTSIALLWETPSKVLDGFNLLFDRNVRRQNTLVLIPAQVAHHNEMMSPAVTE